MVELLLSGGADINAKGYRGRTSLHVAIAFNPQLNRVELLRLLRLLLDKGARVDIKDGFGKTPVDLARELGYPEVARLLERRRLMQRQSRPSGQ